MKKVRTSIEDAISALKMLGYQNIDNWTVISEEIFKRNLGINENNLISVSGNDSYQSVTLYEFESFEMIQYTDIPLPAPYGSPTAEDENYYFLMPKMQSLTDLITILSDAGRIDLLEHIRVSPIIELTNNKLVANFSSPHDFTYEDGSILPAVSETLSEELKVNFNEVEINQRGDLKLEFSLSERVIQEMGTWSYINKYYPITVICPLPMITAIKQKYGEKALINSPFRAIRIEDRIKKLCSINKQCV